MGFRGFFPNCFFDIFFFNDFFLAVGFVVFNVLFKKKNRQFLSGDGNKLKKLLAN